MSEAQFAYLIGCGGTLIVVAFALVLAAGIHSSQISREEEREPYDPHEA